MDIKGIKMNGQILKEFSTGGGTNSTVNQFVLYCDDKIGVFTLPCLPENFSEDVPTLFGDQNYGPTDDWYFPKLTKALGIEHVLTEKYSLRVTITDTEAMMSALGLNAFEVKLVQSRGTDSYERVFIPIKEITLYNASLDQVETVLLAYRLYSHNGVYYGTTISSVYAGIGVTLVKKDTATIVAKNKVSWLCKSF